jgi:hypothetical protein
LRVHDARVVSNHVQGLESDKGSNFSDRPSRKYVGDAGCHCKSTNNVGSYTQIGNAELIEKRVARPVECAPGGTLSDYVPFYFTPYTPMLYNIKTGYNGVVKRPMEDILILVSSLHRLAELKVPFVFSDRHAYLRTAQFSNSLADLDRIIWTTLQNRDFRNDDIDKFEKYQAEALVYKHMPLDALLGVICLNDAVRAAIQADADARGLKLKIVAQPQRYL